MKTIQRVTKGLQFRASYADSNPLWETVRRTGDAWVCVIVNEPINIDGRFIDSDWAGTIKAFLTSEILASVRFDAQMSELRSDDDRFFDSLKVGDIVHYHHGFGEFARCEVINAVPKSRDGNPKGTRSMNLLQPIALVGEWREFDLPRRQNDGSIYYPLLSGDVVHRTGAWRPSGTCVFEHPRFAGRSNEDPRNMEPVDLTVPEPDDATKEKERLQQVVNQISELISACDNPVDALQGIQTLLTGVSL